MDCTSLESPSLDLLDKDQPRSPLGKKPLTRPNSKFKISNLRTWSKLVFGFNLVMGLASRNLLGRFAGSGLGRKCSGLCLGRLMPKAIVSRPTRILPERTSVTSSRMFLGLPPYRSWSASLLKMASAFTSVDSQSSIQLELSSETYSGGGSSCFLKSASALSLVKLTHFFLPPPAGSRALFYGVASCSSSSG